MALDLSKLNFFSRLDARSRVGVLLLGVVGVIFLIYLGTKSVSGESQASGPSKVAAPPPGLQSVPGGKLTPEYYRALQESNVQAAQMAQMSGGSAVPTLVRAGSQPSMQGADCTVVCPDRAANIKVLLDEWLKRGAVTPEVAKQLLELADQKVLPSVFSETLDELIKGNKLTPEQGRELLTVYRQQYLEMLLMESSGLMDSLVKNGQMGLSQANQLLDAQKNKVNTSDYRNLLQQMAKEGKIKPEMAQQLLTQYTQQRIKEIIAGSIASLKRMTKEGQLTPDLEKELEDLENRLVPVKVYNDVLQRNVRAGKLTPITANKILDEFKAQKAAIGAASSLDQMREKAEADAYAEIDDLLQSGKITQDVADKLRSMLQSDVSFEEFTSTVNSFVQQNKLTPDIAKLKIADYRAVKNYRGASGILDELQARNASSNEYATNLKRLVQQSSLTPEEAVQLMQEYQASISKTPKIAPPGAPPAEGGFARLQQRLEEGEAGTVPDVSAGGPSQFTAAQGEAEMASAQMRQERIQNLMSAMSGQAQQLVASWQPPTMVNKVAVPPPEKKDGSGSDAGDGTSGGTSGTTGSGGSTAPTGPVVIKAGSIMFAVLDTEVNSDYPDSPVMATIVEGKYKGAKLMGKMVTTKGVSGQMDRVALNFTVMNVESWPKTKTVTAYGVDPEKARTVMATDVNYHYLQRFGATMATSFLQGYSSAITNAGTSATTTTGMSSTHPQLNPSSKIMVGLGQIGTTLGTITQNYVNIPPTVKVDSGVGLGILFMSDVT